MHKEHVESQNCIKAMKTELKCLRDLCINVFDKAITTDKEPLHLYYPLNTDYFTIFNNNSAKIGKIKDDKERELILSIYVTAKYFLDCIRTNNKCLENLENAETQEDIEWANDNLLHSKLNNILPAYIKLKELLNILFS